MASCCCSPPESCPAGCRRRAPRIGNISNERSRSARTPSASARTVAPSIRFSVTVRLAKDVAAFGNERDPLRHHIFERDAGKRFAGKDDAAGRGRNDAGDGRDERGLAGTVRPHDADDLALAYGEIDAAHRGHGAIAHDQTGHLQQWHARAHCSLSGPRYARRTPASARISAGVPAAMVLPPSST